MSESAKSKMRSSLVVTTTLAGLVASVVITWLLAPALMSTLFNGNLERMGQAGDLFGSVNALFSGLAFAGLFWTVFLQRDQLALQRNELALQRDELRLQREEMAASRSELANQVKAQLTLAKVSAAQIHVASHQAHIEANKLQFQLVALGGDRALLIQSIMARGDTLHQLGSYFDQLTDWQPSAASA